MHQDRQPMTAATLVPVGSDHCAKGKQVQLLLSQQSLLFGVVASGSYVIFDAIRDQNREIGPADYVISHTRVTTGRVAARQTLRNW